MKNTFTNVTALETAITTLSAIEGFDSEVITKLENIKASYSRKRSGERKPTPVQLENEKIKTRIVEFLNENVGENYSITDLTKVLEGDYSVSKITSLCTALWNKGENPQIRRVEEKRKAYFTSVNS